MIRDVAGRAADLGQLALGAAILGPAFRWLARARPAALARTRHEPFAARGEAFVRAVGVFEKAAFVAKMLGSDGNITGGARASAPPPTASDELLFAGDVLYPGSVDEHSLSDALRARIAQSAAFVVNLEGTLGARAHEIAPLLTWRGLEQLLEYERDPTNADWVSRFDVGALRALLAGGPRVIACVANNHTLDDGVDGFDRTLTLLRGMGVDLVGDARTDDGVTCIDVGAYRVGLFALAYGSNRPDEDADRHLRFDGVPYDVGRRRVEALVSRVRARGATHVVALLHWGYEHEHEPAAEQRACARLFESAGVSAVLGHHPHLVQRSEAAGGRWVTYSLGDFVGGDRTIWSRYGSLVALRFGPHGAVSGEVVPTVQTPFWRRQRTMLLAEAPAFERAVYARLFGARIG